MYNLSLVGLACRYDAHRVMAGGVDHHEQTLFDHTYQLIAFLAVVASGVGMHDSIGVKKRPRRIDEIEPTLCKAQVAFSFISFEIHMHSVVHWTTYIKVGGWTIDPYTPAAISIETRLISKTSAAEIGATPPSRRRRHGKQLAP